MCMEQETHLGSICWVESLSLSCVLPRDPSMAMALLHSTAGMPRSVLDRLRWNFSLDGDRQSTSGANPQQTLVSSMPSYTLYRFYGTEGRNSKQ